MLDFWPNSSDGRRPFIQALSMFKVWYTSRAFAAPLGNQFRLHSTTAQPKFGFALDIDGVLIKVRLNHPRLAVLNDIIHPCQHEG